MTTSTNIQFPQGPIADANRYITLEWQQWFQNPSFITFKFQTVLDVTSGGTGVATLTQNGVLLGNGASAITATAAGTSNTILQGNTGSAPTFKNTINAIAIGGTTPAAGAFTTLSATGSIASSSPSGGVGYSTGAGSTTSQSTDKTTPVTIDAVCGTITMNGALLASGAIATFTVNNSSCAATDVIAIQHDSVGTLGGYTLMPSSPTAGSFKVSVRNTTGGGLSEAIVLRFAIIKAVVS